MSPPEKIPKMHEEFLFQEFQPLIESFFAFSATNYPWLILKKGLRLRITSIIMEAYITDPRWIALDHVTGEEAEP